ncbi:MAG: nucleotide exchange factor GrpE [Solirubrobacterales bacterium]|nr:nucleotide exchange factor GrpE [Solirubrobacterales bacterium]
MGRPEDERAAERAAPTEQADAAEPAGEQDAANEAERFVDAEAAGGPAPGEDEDELTVALRERGEYLALAQRTQADFENFRKRAARDAAAAGERAKSGLVRELLPVVDNLERAIASAAAGEAGGDGRPPEHLADGVRLVHSELVAVLARNGVEGFDPRGEKFDPELHEALSMRSEDGAESGTVLDVVEKGYRLNGTVLRPARVVVCG